MAKLLDALVIKFAKEKNPGCDDGDLFVAAKELEKDIVEEILDAKKEELDKYARERELEGQAKRVLDEARTTIIQCVFLALVVGLLVNHLYDVLCLMIYNQGESPVPAIGVGILVLILICIGFVLWLLISRLKEKVNTLYKRKP